jgi:hypothetical protein
MCTIAVKSKGVGMPRKKCLKNCFENNSDGAGFMYLDREHKSVVIDKGYMTWEVFWKAVCRMNFTKDDTVVFHFRLATTGLTCAANCHPFPLSQDEDDLKSAFIHTDVAVVHNGVFGKGEGTMSDTMVHVRDIFSDPLIKENLDSLVIQTLLDEYVVGSKLAFLDSEGDITLFGGPWPKDEGIWYSNDDYERVYVRYGFGGEYEYVPSCPLCREFDDIVSDYQGIFECVQCGCVYDNL